MRLLLILTNANLLALLFLLGIVGIVFELTHPGIVLPGLLGGVSLLLALLGLSIVPFSWAGLALLGLGLVLLGAEAHVPAHGAFAGVGLLAAALGMFILFRVDNAPYGSVSPIPIVLVTASVGLLLFLVVRKVVEARHSTAAIGRQRGPRRRTGDRPDAAGAPRSGHGRRRALARGRRRWSVRPG